MKLRKFAWVLVLAMLVAGCGKKEEKEPSNTGSNIEINTGKEENAETTENNENVETQESTDNQNISEQNGSTENTTEINETTKGEYDDLLSYIRDLILDPPEFMIDMEGMGGIREAIRNLQGNEALSSVGYSIEDLNGDTIPELMIGSTNDKKMIFSLYTLVDEKPTLIFEGFYRSMYQYLGEGKLFYSGSGGAMYSIVATYKFNGTELVCEDYYFTHEKDANFTEIGYFHNTSGVDDITVSEEITGEDFEQISSKLRQEAKDIEWTSFEEY